MLLVVGDDLAAALAEFLGAGGDALGGDEDEPGSVLFEGAFDFVGASELAEHGLAGVFAFGSEGQFFGIGHAHDFRLDVQDLLDFGHGDTLTGQIGRFFEGFGVGSAQHRTRNALGPLVVGAVVGKE